MTQASKNSGIVLVVDFDGTLILKDIFKTTFYHNLWHRPLRFFKILMNSTSWVNFKSRLVEGLDSDVLQREWHMHRNDFLFEWIKSNREIYRKIVVVSASPQDLVKRVIPEGTFDGTYGSTIENLKGKKKLEFILSHWGKNFAYIGNDDTDEVIFAESVLAYRIDRKGQMLKIKDVQGLDKSTENKAMG